MSILLSLILVSWTLGCFRNSVALSGLKYIRAISILRCRLVVVIMRAQCLSLHGRLDGQVPDTTAAAGRRRQAAEQDRRWRQEEQAHASARRFGHTAWRTGFARTE